jgi:hypothetical protein
MQKRGPHEKILADLRQSGVLLSDGNGLRKYPSKGRTLGCRACVRWMDRRPRGYGSQPRRRTCAANRGQLTVVLILKVRVVQR